MFTILKFLKNHGPYTPGDVAGFNEVAAQDYLASGVAELAIHGAAAEIASVAPEPVSAGDTVQATATPTARRGRPLKS